MPAIATLIAMAFGVWAASVWGIQVGFQFYGSHDLLQAQIYGYPTVFMFGWCAGYLLWPPVRRIAVSVKSSGSQQALSVIRWRKQPAAIPLDQLEKAIEAGMPADYFGNINRDFAYTNSNGRDTVKRITCQFQVRRNTRVMSRRERRAYFILCLLEQLSALSAKDADWARFSIVHGNGSCEVMGSAPNDPAVMRPNGIKNFRDLINFEAGERSASVESAFSSLMTSLQQYVRHEHVHAIARRVYEEDLPRELE